VKKNDGKKSTKKNTGKKIQGKKYVKKIREKSPGKKVREIKYGKKVRQDRTSSGHVTVSLPLKKGPTRADIAQLPVVHAQNILPNRAPSGHVTSGHFRSSMRNGITSRCSPSNAT
jgi:hypothetical protein